MGRLIYSAIASLDGYVADKTGSFEWAAPDDEVFAAVNELERPIGTYLYGRRMYETMMVWEAIETVDQPAVVQDFASIWRAADKVVYSTTLDGPSSSRTRVERSFDPVVVRELVAGSATDVSVGGPGLASAALAAGLVDELHLFALPITVGGGTSALPAGLRLELLDERRFRNGTVQLHYRVSG